MSGMMSLDVALDEIAKNEKSKGTRRGGRGSGRMNIRYGQRKTTNLPNKWRRDKFQPKNKWARKILVSNLSFMVTDEDVRELFSEFGTIKKSYVNYDKAGRSHGSAEITFMREEDASAAVKKYNGVTLDGRPMRVEFVSPQISNKADDAPRRNFNRNRFEDSRNNQRKPMTFSTAKFGLNRGRKGVGKSLNKHNKGGLTKESLDADLEAYRKCAEKM